MATLLTPPRVSGLTLQEQKWREEISKRVSQIQLVERTTDPTNPKPGDVWVRYSGGIYELSFRVAAGFTVRVTLT